MIWGSYDLYTQTFDEITVQGKHIGVDTETFWDTIRERRGANYLYTQEISHETSLIVCSDMLGDLLDQESFQVVWEKRQKPKRTNFMQLAKYMFQIFNQYSNIFVVNTL